MRPVCHPIMVNTNKLLIIKWKAFNIVTVLSSVAGKRLASPRWEDKECINSRCSWDFEAWSSAAHSDVWWSFTCLGRLMKTRWKQLFNNNVKKTYNSSIRNAEIVYGSHELYEEYQSQIIVGIFLFKSQKSSKKISPRRGDRWTHFFPVRPSAAVENTVAPFPSTEFSIEK